MRVRGTGAPRPGGSALSEVLPRPWPRPRGGAGSRALLLPPHTSGLGRPLVWPSLTGAGRGGRAGGAGAPVRVRVRERRPPLPRPALLSGPGRRGLGGGAAPRECQVRGRPTRGQRAWGRDRGPFRLCTPRAPRRGGDLAGTTPCPELAQDRPALEGVQVTPWGESRHAAQALNPRGSQGFLAPPVPAQMGALETVTANAESCV